jgi:pyruvate-formate lyase-activating enzyme
MSGIPLTVVPYIFDLELSGKCNTICTFCPRHEMKRGEEMMSEENFEFFIAKLKRYAEFLENRECFLPTERSKAFLGSRNESPLRVLLCGMGESLMHKRAPEWIGRIRREVGVRVSVVTNGLLLTEKKVEALRDADITIVLVSMPGVDRETYSKVMKIDFDRVMNNIERANKILPGRIQINASIPDHATFTEQDVMRLWESKGIPIAGISRCHNRGGFLEDPTITGSFSTSSKFCGILARHNFVAWDGRILACCHDLHAEAVFGHVATHEFVDIAIQKTPTIAAGPDFKICAKCNDRERCHAQQIIGIPKENALTESNGLR